MDTIDQLQELRELNERIICPVTFEVRCLACQHRDNFYFNIPVSQQLYEDHGVLESYLAAQLAPDEVKPIAAWIGCSRCSGKDFEIGAITRLPAYRDGDPMRLPVELA
jgi:hypothetical protein